MLSFVNAALFYELICPLLRFKSGGVRAPATASSQMMEVEEGIYHIYMVSLLLSIDHGTYIRW